MPINRSSVFLEVIESLSKNSFISEGDVSACVSEILYNASNFLKIARVNAWLLDDENTKLTSLLAYKMEEDAFYKESDLFEKDFPIYFNHIRRNDIIISYDAQEEFFNKELVELYLKPYSICSMMEVPILSGGKFKGIICFENTETKRDWTNDEQHFAVALTQLLILTLETKEKNTYREELEKTVKEKTVLIAEINHRVKNNLAVITALIRAESNRAKDTYHKELFDNILSKSFTLSALQNAMYQSQNYNEANFSEFIKTLLSNMSDTYGYNLNVKLDLNLGEINIDVTYAIPCSLIVNELLTNCYKYAFKEGAVNELKVELVQSNPATYKIVITDNGPGLPIDYLTKGTGYDLMEGLIDQIDGKLQIESSEKGTMITVLF